MCQFSKVLLAIDNVHTVPQRALHYVLESSVQCITMGNAQQA